MPRQSEDTPLPHGGQRAPTPAAPVVRAGSVRQAHGQSDASAPSLQTGRGDSLPRGLLQGAAGPAAPVGRAALGQAGVFCACPPHGRWAPGPQNNLPALLPDPPRAELWNPKPWRCLAPAPPSHPFPHTHSRVGVLDQLHAPDPRRLPHLPLVKTSVVFSEPQETAERCRRGRLHS